MAKNKMIVKEKARSAWEGFSGLRAEGGWTIEYSQQSRRASLYQNGEFKFSDVALSSIKNVALTRYGVSNWTRKSG